MEFWCQSKFEMGVLGQEEHNKDKCGAFWLKLNCSYIKNGCYFEKYAISLIFTAFNNVLESKINKITAYDILN